MRRRLTGELAGGALVFALVVWVVVVTHLSSERAVDRFEQEQMSHTTTTQEVTSCTSSRS